jgi:hypothetical protein
MPYGIVHTVNDMCIDDGWRVVVFCPRLDVLRYSNSARGPIHEDGVAMAADTGEPVICSHRTAFSATPLRKTAVSAMGHILDRASFDCE